MKTAITRLDRSIKEIEIFLNFASSLKEVVKIPSQKDEDIANVSQYITGLSWKKHVYSFMIVSIYGAHERFIKDLCLEAVTFISKIYSSYEEIPEKIRDFHEKLTLEKVQEISSGRYGSTYDIRTIISKLHSCFNGSLDLNFDFFSSSNSNFRSKTIRDIFQRLSVDVPDASPEGAERIVSTELSGLYSNTLTVLDKLADLRNQVAHGADYEILDKETLISISKVIYLYDCWLFVQVALQLKKSLMDFRTREVALITKTYACGDTVRSIASVESVSEELKKGVAVYCKNEDGNFDKRVIRTITKESIEIGSAIGDGPFGIDFDDLVRKNQRICVFSEKYSYLLREIDEAISFDSDLIRKYEQ